MLKDLRPDGDRFIDPDGCSWESRANYMFTGVLPSCGCGDPASIGKYVFDMLSKYVSIGQNPPEEVALYEDLPVMFFLSWADREGYTEHGTTVRCSWISDKGKELLADLKEVLVEVENEVALSNPDPEPDKKITRSVADLASEDLRSTLATIMGIPKGYLGTLSQ